MAKCARGVCDCSGEHTEPPLDRGLAKALSSTPDKPTKPVHWTDCIRYHPLNCRCGKRSLK